MAKERISVRMQAQIKTLSEQGHSIRGRFHGTYPPNINEGTHLISGKGPTQFQVVPFVF